jgi:hypothetical protein
LPNRPAIVSTRRAKNQKRSTARTYVTLVSSLPRPDYDHTYTENAQDVAKKTKIIATGVEQNLVGGSTVGLTE